MPTTVSDAGPLIHLAQIGKPDLLQKLFGNLTMPLTVKVEVYDEGMRVGRLDAADIGQALEQGWLEVEEFPARLNKAATKLAQGENISCPDAQALLLAKDKDANLLTDDTLVTHLAKDVWRENMEHLDATIGKPEQRLYQGN